MGDSVAMLGRSNVGEDDERLAVQLEVEDMFADFWRG
jgi:hypothetical protein